MTPVEGIPLPGCRHDVLGHALKAVGVLRALAECAAPDARDPSAEGWWDRDTATFRIRSGRYPDAVSLTKFFTEKYRPTPIIAAWNKSGGVTDKIEVAIGGEQELIDRFRTESESQLAECGLKKTKKLSKQGELKFPTDAGNRATVESVIASFNITIEAESGGTESRRGLSVSIISKTSGKKDGTLPAVERLIPDDVGFSRCLDLARQFVDMLQGEEGGAKDGAVAFLRYRDQLPDIVAESFDALCTLHLTRDNDNPLFVRRGRPGDKVNADIFLSFWEYFVAFRRSPEVFARASLFAENVTASGVSKKDQQGKGTPFFPDAIKSYNQGADWVTEDYPFCPLDYLVAVEGGLAMRGATSKTLNARSRTRAAFPFVFEATEAMTDEQGKALKLASSFWLPIWARPTGYHELQSFILDAQARLPAKDCRFSSDFGRAVRSHGVDAGIFAFQEFRFKLKGANVPWTVTGRFVPCTGHPVASVLNELLAPVDESGFLNQFEFRTSRETRPDLHPLRVPILEAIEAAAVEPSGSKILDVLSPLADLNTQLAKSKSLREKVGTGRVVFVPPLRCEDWSGTPFELETDREFEIARAVASIRGRERQPDGTYSHAEPFLGSLVPLQRGQRTWFLPDPPSPQAVWSGIDLPRDLSAVLARRVIDSEPDVRPALVGACFARLTSILAFLRGELDDRQIGRLIEALSLIDWQQPSLPQRTDPQDADDAPPDAVPVAYAAVRSLIEIACDARSSGVEDVAAPTPRAFVQRTVSLVSRQEQGMVAASVAEALRRLAIVGVPNTYGEDTRRQKPTLAGRDVVALGTEPSRLPCDPVLARRLATAVLIPLDRRDRWKLFRAVTLPQTT